MPGPNAVGGSVRTPSQTPVTDRAPSSSSSPPPSAEQQQESAIERIYTARGRTRRRSSTPDPITQASAALARSGGYVTGAAAMLPRDTVRALGRQTGEELRSALTARGAEPAVAEHMVHELSEHVAEQLKSELRTQGHALIADQRAMLERSRDVIGQLRSAPAGTPLAAAYKELVGRHGKDVVDSFTESIDTGLEMLDSFDRRLDGQAWELREMGDAARGLGPVRAGSLADQAIGHVDQVGRLADDLVAAAEVVHLSADIAEIAVAVGHGAQAAAEITGAGIGAVAVLASLAAHHIAHGHHEVFVEGMNQLFERAR